MGMGHRVYAVSMLFAFLVALADLGDVAVIPLPGIGG